ncbi:thermonuclease family protein [Agromyces humatus]|uniref:TNase-like domain-containing protein n=1 Tax=Agromyces humatus TaxID=279573 RepID=A0ABN2KML9_9MICO|nr:thermonuclease family protein [Agromyces humatus]
MRVALITLVVLTLVRPFAMAAGEPAALVVNVLWGLSIAGVALVGVVAFMKRTRVMSLDEHRYYYANQSEKPARLVWPGHEIPKVAVPQYRGELLLIAAAFLGAISLFALYRSHLVSLGTPSDQIPADPVAKFLIAFTWILALAWLVRAFRRLQRGTLVANRSAYSPWSTHALARWYRERRVSFLAVATVASIAVIGIGGVAASAPAWAEDATVVKIVDGDTVDVAVGGRTERVRLLNVNTPELNGGEAECLAEEARDALATLIPVGSTVTLAYDVVRIDRFGRTLAAVRTADDVLVNAELAARGLGGAAFYGDNDRFLSDVEDGVRQAQASERGFYDPAVACSPASAVAAVEAQLAAAAAPLPVDSVGIESALAGIVATVAAVETAEAALTAMKWLPLDARSYYVAALADLRTNASSLEVTADAALVTTRAVEKAAAEKAAAEKAAAEKAAAERAAAEKAAAEAADAARRAAEQAAAAEDLYSGDTTSDGNDSSGGGGSSDGGGSTYTGCRNYNGYGMIDTEGRHFEPIPCP